MHLAKFLSFPGPCVSCAEHDDIYNSWAVEYGVANKHPRPAKRDKSKVSNMQPKLPQASVAVSFPRKALAYVARAGQRILNGRSLEKMEEVK